MSGQFFVSKIHSRVEIETTELGLAAFDGRTEVIKAAIENGIHWDSEAAHLLVAAIHGNQMEIARLLLRSGMPVRDFFYPLIFNWSPDQTLLNELPERPELMLPLERGRKLYRFLLSITAEDLPEVKKNLIKDKINEESGVLGGQVKMRPIHYAARKCNLEIISFLVEEGAKINTLNEEGKSVLRLIAECPSVEKEERRECYRYIENLGGQLVPPVHGWFTKWSLRRGMWLVASL